MGHRAFAKAASLLLHRTLYYMIRPSSVFTVINTFAGLESGLEARQMLVSAGVGSTPNSKTGLVLEVPLWVICFLPESTMTVDGRGLPHQVASLWAEVSE